MTATSATNSPRSTKMAKTSASVKRTTAAPKTANTKPRSSAVPQSAPVKAQRAAPKPAGKAAAPVKAAQAAAPVQQKTAKAVTAPVTKEKKVKVVRDSFTIPKNEFNQLADMKKKALGLGLEIKKSELIRAGLMLLNTASDVAFKKALANVPTLKTGRPGKN